MRASLGLACAQATTLSSQGFDQFLEKAIRGPEPGAKVFEPLPLTPDLRAPAGRRVRHIYTQRQGRVAAAAGVGRPSTFSSVFFLSCCL